MSSEASGLTGAVTRHSYHNRYH